MDIVNPITLHPEYVAASRDWSLIDALMGGRNAMLDGGRKWLPQEPKENWDQYHRRLNQSFLFPAFSKAVRSLASRPFGKRMTIDSTGAEELAAMLADDATEEGQGLHDLCADWFRDGLAYGISHILVDMSAVGDGGIVSEADAALTQSRPFLLHIKAKSLFSWSFAAAQSGRRDLASIKWAELDSQPEGQYILVREMTVSEFRVWRSKKTLETPVKELPLLEGGMYSSIPNDYLLLSEGTHNLGRVPLFSLALSDRCGLAATPPLRELAEANLQHWQSASDQSNILHVLRVAILFLKGFAEKDLDAGVTISIHNAVASSSPTADMKYVEHSGAGVSAGAADIAEQERRMEQLGALPAIERSQDATATGATIADGRAQTDLAAWVAAANEKLRQIMAEVELASGKKAPDCEIYGDFTLDGATEDKRLLFDLASAGKITGETLLKELKRRGMLADAVDPTTESEAAAAEGAASIGASFGGSTGGGF